MQGQRPSEGGASSSGRHRKPASGSRRPLPFIVAAALALTLIAVVVLVQVNRGSTEQQADGVAPTSAGAVHPSSAVPQQSASPSAASPSVPPAATSSTTPSAPSSSPTPSTTATDRTATPSGPLPRAVALSARVDAALAAAPPQALVATAPLGENVWTTAGSQSGRWEATTLPNDLSMAKNNDLALRAGKVTVSAGVRGSGGPVAVRAPNGTLTLRRESAAQTAQRMREVGGQSCATCTAVTLTSAEPATITVATTVGSVLAPAWSFGVAGSKVRLVRPALSPGSLIQVSPPYRAAVPADVEAAQLPLWKVAVGKDGRTVTANLDRKEVAASKACWRLRAVQTNRSVSLFATPGRAEVSGACADTRGRVALRLASVLGDRVLLDSYWERALPVG